MNMGADSSACPPNFLNDIPAFILAVEHVVYTEKGLRFGRLSAYWFKKLGG